jgi:hypothetical protein
MSRTTRTPSARRRSTALAGLTAAVLAGGLLPATSASADDRRAPAVRTLESGLFSPLTLDPAADGSVWYAQNFAGTLHQRTASGKVRTRFKAGKPGREVGAVSERRGSVRFAVSFENRHAVLWGIGDSGKPRRMADLMAHERRTNPDGRTTYGFSGLDAECAASLPAEFPASYTGIVESHPYATYLAKGGTTYVADAAANAILAVPRPGVVRTVAVIPPATTTITAQFAETAGLPECVVGETYRFESVPTDVEMGPDGRLYVTTLPGGPEDGSLGANAAVHRVDPRTGSVRTVVTGLTSATGLAVAPNGDVFVSELFGGRIVRARKGSSTARTFLEVPLPGDVELGKGGLYATTHVLAGLSGEPGDEPAGRLVRIKR